MRRIFLFMHVSLDGYFEGIGHDITWARGDGDGFSREGGEQVDTVLLGRRTYELMASYWPTPEAQQSEPEIAQFMNEKLKVVASHNAFTSDWQNVRVISKDVVGEIRKLKEGPGGSIAMFGSNNLCVNLMEAGLVDEFQIMVNPVALGQGTSLFQGLSRRIDLKLTDTRQYPSGVALMVYEPA